MVLWKSALLAERAKAAADPQTGLFPNNAIGHATDMMKSERARLDAQLIDDFNSILKGNCVYASNFLCDKNDYFLFEKLKGELTKAQAAERETDQDGQAGMVDWSKHMKFENPSGISQVFQEIVELICEYFDTEMFASRLNYYGNGQHWKPFHHDSHAYGAKGQREDITIGVSLGATRELTFLHQPSSRQFSFPQKNGDVFSFTSEVNSRFQHGVPRGGADCGERFSIIVWGKRRSVNARNGGGGGGLSGSVPAHMPMSTVEDAINAAQALVSVSRPAPKGMGAQVETDEASPNNNDGSSNAKAVAAKPKKKNRLQ